MAFDSKLADRIRERLGKRKGLTEKKMFGGIAFLLNGNMCCGVHKDGMIVRLNPAETDAALSKHHTRVFDLTGRPMKGWILIESAGLSGASSLDEWIGVATTYAASLPAK